MSHRRIIPTAGLAATVTLALVACAPASPQGQPTAGPAPASSSDVPSPALQSGATGEAHEPGLDATKPINADNWTSSVSMLPPCAQTTRTRPWR